MAGLRGLTRLVRIRQDFVSPKQHHQHTGFNIRSLTMLHPEVVFMDPDPHAARQSSSKHVSVNPEGIELIDLEFIEEPLGVTAEQGYGFPRIEFGDLMGPDKRYKVVRKLGWGMNSSVWMAFDEKEEKHVAIKVLKGYATNLSKRLTCELPALQRVASIPPPVGFDSTYWPQLLSHFIHPGRGQDGDHLCIVTEVFGGDVKRLQVDIAKKGFPLPLAKRILLHTLRGLAHMHKCEIVHTDIKHDNIMFDVGTLTRADIATVIEKDPSRRHPPEESWKCTVQAAVSQPLPLPSLAEAATRNYFISDFGNAQPSAVHTFGATTPPPLCAPEIILQGPWNEKVDIWTFGCLIFELTTGCALFEYKPYPKYALDEVTSHLWQILCFTQERITDKQVQECTLGIQYFDLPVNPDDLFCDLKGAAPRINNSPFTALLKQCNILDEADVLATANIMQRCLRLNSKDRATAQELLLDPWWHGAA